MHLELRGGRSSSYISMPPPRLLLSCSGAFRHSQLRSQIYRKYVLTTTRSCSCSAPHTVQKSVKFSSQASQKNDQLNSTTSDPPTPPTDHRTLAQSQDLFITSPYSPGSPLLLPNGTYVFQKLQSFLRAQYPQFGYQEVITPTIYKKSLWEKSGHWENYAEDMFSVQGRGATGTTKDAEAGQNEEFGLKPMNCPGHCLLFRDEIKSYRDLPVRFADFSALHRNEISGALTGLTRVRRFHQDDAHIFCRPDQILGEIEQTLRFVGMVYDTFNLGPYKLLLSTRPEDHFIGTVSEWDRAESQLTTALNNSGREWALNPGDGAFYGPKIDIILKDNQGKEHQTATIQLDFQLPQRFDLQYQASPQELEAASSSTSSVPSAQQTPDPTTLRPVIIHRAIYGSLERFLALLIEHYAGKYPFWLSPRPATILSLNQDPKVLSYISSLQAQLSGISPPSSSPTTTQTPSAKPTPQPLKTTHLPITTDVSARPLGKKLADAIAKQTTHIIVVGTKEIETGTLTLELANLNPHTREATEGVLAKVMGLKGGAGELPRKKNGKVAVKVTGEQARVYFEELVDGYL